METAGQELPRAHEWRIEPREYARQESRRGRRHGFDRLRSDRTALVVTGTVANVCCESSARDASTLGFRIVMVADANAAMRDQDLNATLHTFYRTFGDVRPTSEVLDLITGGRA